MKTFKILILLGLVLFTSHTFGQEVPESYQGMFNEIIVNFKSIRSGNSIYEGKNSLRVLSDDRIVIRTEHKRKVKNLTFVTKEDEDGNSIWIADNQLTIDMVNKYEEYLTEMLISLKELSAKKAKE